MYDFSKPICGNDVTVCLIDEFKEESLLTNAKIICDNYGIKFFQLLKVEDIGECTFDTNIVHFIFRLKREFDHRFISEIQSFLPIYHRSISIAFSYKSKEDSISYTNVIEEEKNHQESAFDCFNIMRPDIYFSDYFTVSQLKLLDNIVCDTIRVKYTPICISSDSIENELPKTVIDFFERAAELYEINKMYHRSFTDGYFSIKYDGIVYITATKTRKDKKISLKRISIIHSYCELKNELVYTGAYVPSSDSVEAMIVYQNTNVLELIHTHDSCKFTRNPNANIFPRIEPMEYGTSELGYKIVSTILGGNCDLVIMEEHGEVFLGYDHSESCSTNAIVNALGTLGFPKIA